MGVLQPIAVLPFTKEDVPDELSLENLAAILKGELVYGVNEFGNPLAVGVFVTNEFHRSVDEQVKLDEASKAIRNGQDDNVN